MEVTPEKTGQWIEDKYIKHSKKKESLPDWFQNKHVEEKEIDTETSVALKKRLENLKKKRPENKSSEATEKVEGKLPSKQARQNEVLGFVYTNP